MTDSTPGAQDADDARLLNMVRAGDSGAFGVIYERHVAAARRLARRLVPAAEADDVVAETFAWVFDVTRRGGGPSNAVRPYVLTAVRRVCSARRKWLLGDDAPAPPVVPAHRELPAPPGQPPSPEPGEPFIEPATAGLETRVVALAYLSLPESWRAVLWHADVEGARPEELALLLGLGRNGVVAMRRQAIQALRQAYLQLQLSRIARPECTPVLERLGAFLADAQSVGDTAIVTEHLSRCADCREVYEELADIKGTLRAVIAPLVLGPAADAYLADGRDHRAAAAVGRHTAAGPADGAVTTLVARRTPAWLRRLPRPYRALAAGMGAGVAAVAAVALAAAALTGNNKEPVRTGQPAPGASKTTTLQAPTTLSPAPERQRRPAPSPTSTPSPAQGGLAAAPAQLTATIGTPGRWTVGHPAHVTFQVTNSGRVGTGTLTASIALPPGTSVLGNGAGGSGGGSQQGNIGQSDQGWPDGTASPLSGGWSCQPAGNTVTCTHDGLAAGEQAQGMLLVTVSSAAACGQPVRVTVTSGTATATAVQDIHC